MKSNFMIFAILVGLTFVSFRTMAEQTDAYVNQEISEVASQQKLNSQKADSSFRPQKNTKLNSKLKTNDNKGESPFYTSEEVSSSTPETRTNVIDHQNDPGRTFESEKDAEDMIQELVSEDQRREKNRDAYFKAIEKEYERLAMASGVTPEPHLARTLKDYKSKSRN